MSVYFCYKYGTKWALSQENLSVHSAQLETSENYESLYEAGLDTMLSNERKSEVLIRLCGCTG